MNPKFKLFAPIVFVMNVVYCQAIHEIFVKDVTGEPIPFVNIYNNCGYGTITNEKGLFRVVPDSISGRCDFLYLSHLGFLNDSISIKKLPIGLKTETKRSEVTLKSRNIVLDEVILGPLNIKKYLQKIYDKLKDNHSGSFHKSTGYYKQVTKNNEDIVEYLEMINQFEYSNKGVESWQINNGRYANDSSAVFVFKNYSVYVREILKTYGESSILASPVSQYIDSYSFSYGGSFNNNFRIFRFELNKTNKKIILPQKGTLIIDIDTDEIVEINGTITKSLGVKKTFFPYRTRNVVVDFTISYDKGLFMYSQINTSFNIYKLFVKKHTVSVKSFFVNLHEKIEKEEKSMYGSRASDLSKIKQTIYNPLYWTNSAVLRLSEEDEIIEIFENLNLFNND